MSEELSRTDWAEPEVMRPYYAIVKQSADEWLAEHPNAKRRIEIAKPDQCAHAHYLLEDEGLTMRAIAKTTGLTEKELGQLVFRRPSLWESRKKSLAAKMAAAAEELVDVTLKKARMLADNDLALAEEGIKDLALATGIITDKAANLNGMATVKIEHVKASGMEEYAALKAEAQRRLEERRAGAIEAEVIPYGAEVAEA